ncbi:alpha/beta hydrolase fold protein [Plectosphaerella plurivora]|uniref:Alpha/beta hydrolase fold protein n=1 Tax=Plectosphaerella plurivora TaxID=936078 RepID=A0A9P8VK40_9PEZI|nr:alpha/beta hydrolase fold protein [Plectosphaerella plurivora]
MDSHIDQTPLPYEKPSLQSRIYLAAKTSAVKNGLGLVDTAKSIKSYIWSPPNLPNLTKSYASRPNLPIRVFLPPSYDESSSALLPTLFTIHGGGFTTGNAVDDDAWNRHFADTNSVLVVALNYAKAPASPYPGAPNDVQALLHSALEDVSLPIDKTRLAVAGFSAGGNLALVLARAEALKKKEGRRDFADFKAVIPIYPVLNHAESPSEKLERRRWKTGQIDGYRGTQADMVMSLADVFHWAYIPYGQDLRDPSVSPFYVTRDDLPDHVFVLASELDMLAWEDWALALRLAGKAAPEGLPGRERPAANMDLELEDEKFHWNVEQSAGRSVRWLLVPDVLHLFDMKPALEVMADAETVRDGNEKAVKVIEHLGGWLKDTAWNSTKA